jgi:hypothetical protein
MYGGLFPRRQTAHRVCGEAPAPLIEIVTIGVANALHAATVETDAAPTARLQPCPGLFHQGTAMMCNIPRLRYAFAKAGALLAIACGMAMILVMPRAHAAPVYRCVDAHGHLAYRDTPCAAHAHGRKIDLQPQPLIGAPGEHAARVVAAPSHHEAKVRPSKKTRAARARPVTSWECHADDGEVFYRHARCPGSVPGDGVVRSGYAEKLSNSRTRSRQGAWGRVPVHGKKISRAEACRRIHSAGAAVRDGHARDETVSTYDHLMGRDPCNEG